MTYQEKLLDPRWQKKRLCVMNRENFSCQLCGDTNTTLHIHHKEYNGDPWESDTDTLMCCCKHCHGLLESVKTIDIEIISLRKSRQKNGIYTFILLVKDRGDGVLEVHIFSYNEETNKYSGELRMTEKFLNEINKLLSQFKNSQV